MAAGKKRNWPLQAALCAVALTLALMFALSAQAGINRSVLLCLGRRAVTINSAVLRGERNRYTVRGRAEEKLSVRITAREHNAAFQIIAPSGQALPHAGNGDDATRWQGSLPLTGVYTVVVGGTRGNAAYTLTLSRTP